MIPLPITGKNMDMNELGYFIFMQEQEEKENQDKKEKDDDIQEDRADIY